MGVPSLNYRIEGNGPPLLMLHGFGISFNIWSSLLPLLSPHFTLVMVELPGIGKSPMPERGADSYLETAAGELEKLRRLLRIQSWNIFSYSSGTRVAERYIQLYPMYVNRAVFLCPAQVSATKAFGLNIVIWLDQHIPQFGNWLLSGDRLRFWIDLLGFNCKRNNLSRDWFAEISSQPVDILKETLRSLPDRGKRPFCTPANIPEIFIWGYEDLITGVPLSESSQNSRIHATHSAPQTATQNVCEVVLPFLLPVRSNA
jgi:pimeloyl-ACP methyl ester carboxylesterase